MKVLFATDGSEYSETAARFLTRINWSSQDSIAVFHAIFAVPFPEDQQFHSDTLKAVKKELAPRILDSAVRVLGTVKARISTEIHEFPPAECTPDQCIIKAAESSKADLIVMGARGTKGVGSAFLGSVARLVAVRSPLPVLAIKRRAGEASGAMKVLAAADDSPQSRASTQFLSSIPFAEDAEATVLHVVASVFSDIPEPFAPEIIDRIKEAVAAMRTRELEAAERVLEEARGILAKRFRTVSVLSKVGDPSAEIVQAAEAMGADIIASGCRGLRGIRGMMGSVSKNILTHAGCSVLIGRTCGE